jgi:adenine-specific DNA-methyltransferase
MTDIRRNDDMVTSKYDRYSKDELIRIIAERDRKPRLGLLWERDEIAHDHSLNEDFVALDLVPSLSSGGGPWHNLLIEGDNFDALRYLRMTHAGRVKCICIDPPYNTGNRDFIYNDRFVDKDDVWKHSKWLEYLYRRLLLARDLLAEDGVLLVFINDENRAKLELLLDQTLPGMRLGSFTWRTKDTGNDAGRNFSQVHEHVLVYGGKEFLFNGNPLNTGKYRNPDNDPNGPWCADPITKAHTFKERPNTYYPIQNPKTGYWYPCDQSAVWRFATEARVTNTTKIRTETIEEFIRRNLIIFPDCKPSDVMFFATKEELINAIRAGKGPMLPKKKTPLFTEDLPDLDFWIGKSIAPGRPSKKSYLQGKTKMFSPVSSWIAGINEAVDFLFDEDAEELELLRSSRGGEGTDAVSEILGTKAFSFPKPPSLIRNILRQATRNDDLVMDFFAGSGTTAQAVLELNREDAGTRRFIMVSATEATADEPEKNICRDVCAERIRRVIGGYGSKEGTGGDFAYLRVKRLPLQDVLAEINHAQVWTALQLIHGQRFSPLPASPAPESGAAGQEQELLLTSVDGASGLVYVTALTVGTVARIAELARQTAHLTVYTWQPGLLRERLTAQGVTIEQIPQFLVNRFGGVA